MTTRKYPTSYDIPYNDIFLFFEDRGVKVDSFPWRSYLSSFDWFKESKVLFMKIEKQREIDITRNGVDSLSNKERKKIIVIQSHVTGKWYPFIQDVIKNDSVIFKKVVKECPIELVILEKEI